MLDRILRGESVRKVILEEDPKWQAKVDDARKFIEKWVDSYKPGKPGSPYEVSFDDNTLYLNFNVDPMNQNPSKDALAWVCDLLDKDLVSVHKFAVGLSVDGEEDWVQVACDFEFALDESIWDLTPVGVTRKSGQNSERVEKAKKILFSETPVDRILDVYDAGDFVEFIGTAGGDSLTFRVYNDGTVGER